MRRLLPALGAAAVLVGVPLAVVSWEARRRGLVAVELLREAVGVDTGPAAPVFSPARRGPASDLLVPRSIGRPVTEPPRIGSVSVADLDRDGLLDVLACDMLEHRIAWLRQTAPGRFEERPVGGEVRAPARVAVADLDGDGDSDLAVAAMGKLFPTNEKIGSVVVLENDGTQAFSRRVLLEGVARVTDVRAGDLDGDGDLDLVVGQFGYDDGEIRWLENEGTRWDSHRLFGLSGTVHAIPADLDGDGDLDIAALVSQEWEETWVFENTGAGAFSPHLVYGSTNDDFGSSGIDLVDLDADGDLDVLYSNGDAFDYSPPRPKPWHGVQWLESLGGWRFAFRRIGDFCGAAAARAADLDGDGDLDVVAVSAFERWELPEAHSLVWFERRPDGWVRRALAAAPTHLIAIEAADLDGDGAVELVTGGMHVYPPYDRMGRVTLWHRRGPGGP